MLEIEKLKFMSVCCCMFLTGFSFGYMCGEYKTHHDEI